jgi:phosphoenolpyruvate synthase/pyruvate phosphate dikinase
LNGKWVSYEVTQSGFKIKESTQPGQKKASLANIQLKSDLRVDSLINIERLGKNVSYYAGNKAANFATLFQLSKRAAFKIPESAFVIPFYFSDQHFKRCGVYERIDSLVQFSAGSLPDSILRKKLAKIRKLILATPLDSMLLKKVESRILALGPYRRMRFRSSTNAEDANGFSGAGVYTSETGEHGNPKRPIERAIKEVWASLWSYDAFLERRYFGIDQRAVFMGVLVHRSFPDEIANGVVISKNLYRENYYGFVVNAQLGDEPVVRPKPGQVTDQFICYPPIDGEVNPSMNKVDIIAFSNLNQNRLILSEKEIQLLAKETERIKSYFYRRNPRSKTYADYAIDLEFKLVGDKRQLYIKQVRPYND